MFRSVRHHLPRSGGGRYRLVPCDCFNLVPLPAFVKIDMPQFNLIIAACAVERFFSRERPMDSTLREAALVQSAMLCRLRDGHLLSDPVGEIPSV